MLRYFSSMSQSLWNDLIDIDLSHFISQCYRYRRNNSTLCVQQNLSRHTIVPYIVVDKICADFVDLYNFLVHSILIFYRLNRNFIPVALLLGNIAPSSYHAVMVHHTSNFSSQLLGFPNGDQSFLPSTYIN